MESKPLSFFKKYALLFVVTCYAGVLLLSWFQVRFLLMYPERYFSGLKITLSITTGLIVIICLIVYKVTRPFQEIMDTFDETGKPLTAEERQTVIGTYRKVNVVSLIGIIIGYAVGNSTSVLAKYLAGSYGGTLLHVIVAMIQSVAFGALVAVYMVYFTNNFFAEYRQKLKITDPHEFKSTMSVTTSLLLSLLASFFFVAIDFVVLPFGLLFKYDPQNIQANAVGLFLSSFFAFVPVGFILVVMVRNIGLRIKDTSEIIEGISKGSVDTQLYIELFDDFGMMKGSINSVISKLGGVVTRMQAETDRIDNVARILETISQEVDGSVAQMENSLHKISGESSSQKIELMKTRGNISSLTGSVRDVEGKVLEESSAMQESTASIAAATENIKGVAGLAVQADEVSKALNETCEQGGETLKQAINAINSISEASTEVAEIVKTIQRIASQTNLLSMNAAIEASHAGDFGAGFMVVADEVRALASSSSVSAKNIQVKMKEMVNRIQAGVDSINSISESFNLIEDSVRKNIDITKTITSALREQQAGADMNLANTMNAQRTTDSIKELVINQRGLTEKVDKSMSVLDESSKKMSAAVKDGNAASSALKEVVARIDETVKTNKAVVDSMKELVKLV